MEWLGEEGEVELESLLFPDAFLLSVMVTIELITYHITKSEINRVSVNIISFKETEIFLHGQSLVCHHIIICEVPTSPSSGRG